MRLPVVLVLVLVLGLVAACGKHSAPPPGPCDDLSPSLAGLEHMSGASLATHVDDAVAAVPETCRDPLGAIRGDGAAQQLARARLLDEKPEAALAALAASSSEPAIRLRRAEILDRLQRPEEALVALGDPAPADAEPLRRLLTVSLAVKRRAFADAAATIAAAPVTERASVAYRAAARADATSLEQLAAAAREPELASAVADRLEAEHGPTAGLAARARAATLAPDRAEPSDAYARALLAAHNFADAASAWDRAAAVAPAQPAYRLSAIRALISAGDFATVRSRVKLWAAAARASGNIDELLAASTAAAAIPDNALAVALARDARSHRPGDGRLAFELASRLADAGERNAAAHAYAELLACGAHGHAWHRHEVATQLLALVIDDADARQVSAALDATPPCEVADRDDLGGYVASLRKKLAPYLTRR